MVDFVVKILRILTNKIQNKILVQKDLQYSETHTKKNQILAILILLIF